MQNEIIQYIAELDRIYKAGNATEHTYRPALKCLLEKITGGLTVTNEPKRIACGAPDYIVTRKEIPVGYIEAKDTGIDLNGKANKAQFDRYKQSLDNLIITDYLTFQLFEGENLLTEIAVGKILPNKIEPIPENFNAFAEMIKTFSLYDGKAIKDSRKLAEYMAAKTQLLAEVIEKTIADQDENNSLRQQLKGFQEVLLPAMTEAQFADTYAQTIAYGMFVARLQDDSNENFTRQHAAVLIPQSNPFLRNLFQYIAGFDLDENIRWIVDSLADMFNYVDVTAIHKEFESKDKDPFLHFYEDFLTKYDKGLKTAMGAYYTPLAAVKFIVKAVDDILKNDFDISTGLADCSYLTPQPPLQKRGGEPGYFTASKSNWINLLKKAKEGRQNSTEGEELLWQNIRNRKLGDKFRRQHPIGEFIPDFVCLGKKLVVEVDGEYHNTKEQQEYDAQRTEYLNSYGYNVIRFTNAAVLNDTKNVLAQIRKHLTHTSPPTPLSTWKGEEPDDSSPLSFGEGSGVRYHRVQILDPATGTGTFLAEVVRVIYRQFANNAGMWNDYVKNHLIPRLNGFEIMMSPYTMAHLKMEMILRETGYASLQSDTTASRLHIYLTDALEDPKQNIQQIPFAQWLTDEASEAAKIKNNAPVMVVLGNPPYSGESQNNGKWIMELINDYKKEPSGIKLQEKNSKWINDDYVKFIRYGQHFIEKNDEGILAFINNHSFLDNPTFRGMRWNLLNTFDKIYILDLHGNAKKKETAPDGGKDENVFDIQQGVSINIFVKKNKGENKKSAQVLHYDLYGKRQEKYNFLLDNDLQTTQWTELQLQPTNYFFVAKDFSLQKEYENGFSVQDLFVVNVLGFQSHRDNFAIDFDKNTIYKRVTDLRNKQFTDEELYNKYNLKFNRDWNLTDSRKNVTLDLNWEDKIINCGYRPFDNRPCYFSHVTMDYPRKELMQHVMNKDNLCLNIVRQTKMDLWKHILVSDIPTSALFVEIKDGSTVFPLYLYPETDKLFVGKTRQPNFNKSIIKEISQRTGLQFTEEKEETPNTFAPIDVLDYIYAVLHSPSYRERYKEFLKIDFPRVPYPQNGEQFWKLVKLGGKLRRLHLLEGVGPQQGMADFPVAGTNQVEKPEYSPPSEGARGGRVYINDTQYFDNVPPEAWNFYIGGYQPAQKWLKDRKGRTLGYDDIRNYQRVIRALKETGEVMREVEEVMGK